MWKTASGNEAEWIWWWARGCPAGDTLDSVSISTYPPTDAVASECDKIIAAMENDSRHTRGIVGRVLYIHTSLYRSTVHGRLDRAWAVLYVRCGPTDRGGVWYVGVWCCMYRPAMCVCAPAEGGLGGNAPSPDRPWCCVLLCLGRSCVVLCVVYIRLRPTVG